MNGKIMKKQKREQRQKEKFQQAQRDRNDVNKLVEGHGWDDEPRGKIIWCPVMNIDWNNADPVALDELHKTLSDDELRTLVLDHRKADMEQAAPIKRMSRPMVELAVKESL